MLTNLTTTITITALVIASALDIKTREVPDWLNYSLIIIGLGVAMIYSLTSLDSSYILNSILGLIICLAIGFAMFYGAQWGGGDSKMLFGLGALIGFELVRGPFLINFLINSLFVGSVYGLVWSVCLVLKNKAAFTKEFKKISENKRFKKLNKANTWMMVASLITIIIINDTLFRFMLISITVFLAGSFYLWHFIKAVEQSVMIKKYDIKKLTPGDWIVDDVVIDKKKIYSTKDLGVSESQIKELRSLERKGKIKKILVKEGIPFVPSFLIAFITTLLIGGFL